MNCTESFMLGKVASILKSKMNEQKKLKAKQNGSKKVTIN
jgi:hypothetical protein